MRHMNKLILSAIFILCCGVAMAQENLWQGAGLTSPEVCEDGSVIFRLYAPNAEEGVANELVKNCSSGGCCINDVIMHIANENMPFGGVGNSGMGRYHGRDSLYAFSHRRAVLRTPTSIDLPFRYMPYRWFRLIKRLLSK